LAGVRTERIKGGKAELNENEIRGGRRRRKTLVQGLKNGRKW
jgi:hypothetical protein